MSLLQPGKLKTEEEHAIQDIQELHLLESELLPRSSLLSSSEEHWPKDLVLHNSRDGEKILQTQFLTAVYDLENEKQNEIMKNKSL